MGLILGMGVCMALGAMRTTEGAGPERYQLGGMDWATKETRPRLHGSGIKAPFLTGVFKIDTQTGTVWALTSMHETGDQVTGWHQL
jgi:hypothetical protein